MSSNTQSTNGYICPQVQKPLLMNDGRFLTNYGSSNELTEQLRKMNGIRGSNEFRNFLQRNGSAFMDAERNHINSFNAFTPNIACSDGWVKLWNDYRGDWANIPQ